MDRTEFEEGVRRHRHTSLPDPIAEMTTWAGRKDNLRTDSSVVALGCSPRVTYALERAGIRTLADLAEVTAPDLLNLDGFDEEAMVELEERLNAFKIRLAIPQETVRWQRRTHPVEAERREYERVERQAEMRPPGYEPH